MLYQIKWLAWLGYNGILIECLLWIAFYQFSVLVIKENQILEVLLIIVGSIFNKNQTIERS